MQLRAQQIFPRLEPYRIVSDLGLHREEKNGLWFTPHPQHRQHRLQIERNEFVGACDGPTPACTVFDFLAMCLGSYEEAIEYAIAHYYNLASLPSGMTFDSVRDQMVLGLQEEREQFENILSLRDPLRKRSEKLIGGYIYCRGKGLDPNHIWRMLYIVRGEDLNLVLQRWLKPGKTFETGECYLVFPYLRSRHAFAALEICDLNEKHLMTLQLIPCAHMFLGLHTCFPDTRQTQVFSTRQEAAANYSQAMERGDYHLGFVHTRFNPNGENSEPSLRSGVFVVTKTTDFNTLVKNGQAFEELKIIDRQGKFAEAIEPVPWRQYGVNSMLKGLREDPKVAYASTLESLRGDSKVLPALLNHLQRHDQKAVVNRIRRQLGGHELFVQGGMHIIEGPTGYVATKPGTNLSSQFTNFLIKIDSSIWFEESEQAYFSGWIVLNGQTVPFFISNAQTHQPRAILLQAQLAANRVAIPNLPMPTIIDPTHQRKLTTIIAQQIGNRPKIIGVQRLGWTPTKDRFVTPTWEARALGLATTSKVLHPGSETIARAFSFLDYKVTDDTSQCTPQGRFLIAIVAAWLTRGFLNQQMPPVRVMRSSQSVALLQSVLRPLGQVAAVELGPQTKLVRRTLSIHNFCRYPLLVTCPDATVLDDIHYPLFMLARSGMALNEAVESEALLQITSLSHRAITSVLLSLIRDPLRAQGLIERDEAPSTNELAFEGKRVIEAISGLGSFDLRQRELPLLEMLLSKILPERAKEYFCYDLKAGLVYIRCRKLPEVARKPLFDELVAKNRNVALHGSHDVACPAFWFIDFLAKFYGRSIALNHQRVRRPSDEVCAVL